jgi:hypothetical protein
VVTSFAVPLEKDQEEGMKGLDMISSEPRSMWQHLRQEDGGKVMIHTKDGDCFGLPFDDLVNACQSSTQFTAFCRQVGTLLDRLAGWLEERRSEVEAAYVGLEPEGAIFVVVRKAKAFDPAFEDALSILDLQVAQDSDFHLIKLRVLALPRSSKETVASFLQLERAFRYAGNLEIPTV